MERPNKLMSTTRKLLFSAVVALALTSAPLRAWAATYTQLAARGQHTCGLKPDGEALCWGLNDSGQSTPPPGPFTQLAAGYGHTCGLKPNGEALCWGSNNWGQSTPAAGPFTQLAAGYQHTCGLKPDGEALCWGRNGHGQATPPPGPFTQLAAGYQHTCGLKPNGEALCWGQNDFGQSTPVAGPFTQLAAGYLHTCGLKPNGDALCWGRDKYGQLTPPPGPFTQLAAGGFHTCGLTPDGEALCWGWNGDGESTPPPGPFTQLTAGVEHTCGLKPNGEALCWGRNDYGQSTPAAGPFTQLAAGYEHTCGLKPNGEALCWGNNDYGQATPVAGPFTQLATGADHTCGLKPNGEALCWGLNDSGQSTPPPGPFTQLAAGYGHTCGLKPNGEALCWGSNNSGQSTPAAGPFTRLAAGWYHTCGLKPDGEALCWGLNNHGQSTPAAGPFTQLAAGDWHTCGLKPNGEALCWGQNDFGQSTPVAGPFTQLAAGYLHTCGLKPNGDALCWGRDKYGQLTPPPGPFTQLAAGWSYTCGLQTNGYVRCWGIMVIPAVDSEPDPDSDDVPTDDGDGVSDPCRGPFFSDCDDNCPAVFNPTQRDADGDGIGDLCDEETTQADCADGVDNDGDGDTDGLDPGCDTDPGNVEVSLYQETGDGGRKLLGTVVGRTTEPVHMQVVVQPGESSAEITAQAKVTSPGQGAQRLGAGGPGDWLVNGRYLVTGAQWTERLKIDTHEIRFAPTVAVTKTVEIVLEVLSCPPLTSCTANCPVEYPRVVIETPELIDNGCRVRVRWHAASYDHWDYNILYSYREKSGSDSSTGWLWSPWLARSEVTVLPSTTSIEVRARYDCQAEWQSASATAKAVLPASVMPPVAVENARPVVFIPGIYGSFLAPPNEGRLWLKCFMYPNEVRRLELDESGSPSEDLVATSVTESVCTKGIYGPFLRFLRDRWPQGYVETLPYDWRLNLKGTDQYTERIFADLDCKVLCDCKGGRTAPAYCSQGAPHKVDLVAHSTGGLLVKEYLIRLASRGSAAAAAESPMAHIGQVIMVGTPHLGAPKALSVLLTGNAALSFLIPRVGVLGITDLFVKILARNFPVAYHLMPSRLYGDPFLEIAVGRGGPRVHSMGNYSGRFGGKQLDEIMNLFTNPDVLPVGIDWWISPGLINIEYFDDDLPLLNQHINEWLDDAHGGAPAVGGWDTWMPPSSIQLSTIYVTDRETPMEVKITDTRSYCSNHGLTVEECTTAEYYYKAFRCSAPIDIDRPDNCDEYEQVLGECKQACSGYEVNVIERKKGDGTVPVKSAKGPPAWNDATNVHRWPLTTRWFRGEMYDHGKMLTRFDVQAAIYGILVYGCQSRDDEQCGPLFCYSEPQSQQIRASAKGGRARGGAAASRWQVMSAAIDRVRLTDAYGNVTGDEAQATVLEIPESSLLHSSAGRVQVAVSDEQPVRLDLFGGQADASVTVSRLAGKKKRLRRAAVYAPIGMQPGRCNGGDRDGLSCEFDSQCPGEGICATETTCELLLVKDGPMADLSCDTGGDGAVDDYGQYSPLAIVMDVSSFTATNAAGDRSLTGDLMFYTSGQNGRATLTKLSFDTEDLSSGRVSRVQGRNVRSYDYLGGGVAEITGKCRWLNNINKSKKRWCRYTLRVEQAREDDPAMLTLTVTRARKARKSLLLMYGVEAEGGTVAVSP